MRSGVPVAVLVSVASALYTETASSSNSSDWSAASDSDTGWVESLGCC